jgi:antitoxin HicB
MAKPSTKLRAARTKRTETVQSARYRYTAIFEPAEEGGYVVTIPALNGLTTEGDTLDEARAMAADAIRCYLESLRKRREEIPVEHGVPILRRIAVSLARA